MKTRFTKQDTIFKHRIMWYHIGHYLEKWIDSKSPPNIAVTTAKVDAFRARFSKIVPPLVHGNCFLCHYAREMIAAEFGIDALKMAPCEIIGITPCKLYCPLNDYINSDGKCLCGLYNKVHTALYDDNIKEASKIAYEIAFLKEVIK